MKNEKIKKINTTLNSSIEAILCKEYCVNFKPGSVYFTPGFCGTQSHRYAVVVTATHTLIIERMEENCWDSEKAFPAAFLMRSGRLRKYLPDWAKTGLVLISIVPKYGADYGWFNVTGRGDIYWKK